MCAQALSCVRLFATPQTVARQAPLSTGILQARALEWVTLPSSGGSSQELNWGLLHCWQILLPAELPGKPPGEWWVESKSG